MSDTSIIRERFATQVKYMPIGINRACKTILAHVYMYGDEISDEQYLAMASKFSKDADIKKEIVVILENAFHWYIKGKLNGLCF